MWRRQLTSTFDFTSTACQQHPPTHHSPETTTSQVEYLPRRIINLSPWLLRRLLRHYQAWDEGKAARQHHLLSPAVDHLDLLAAALEE